MFRRAASTALIALIVALLAAPSPAQAHLAKWGSWEITHRNLMKLFPSAEPGSWKIKRYSYTDDEVKELEKDLGFELWAEDKVPEFFVAYDKDKKLLGVAVFIDPRTKPKIRDGQVLTLEVGIGVNSRGEVNRVNVYDYRGNAALTEREFLDQLKGRTTGSTYQMGKDGLEPVKGDEEESQLVADAAREALLLMKAALGRR